MGGTWMTKNYDGGAQSAVMRACCNHQDLFNVLPGKAETDKVLVRKGGGGYRGISGEGQDDTAVQNLAAGWGGVYAGLLSKGG